MAKRGNLMGKINNDDISPKEIDKISKETLSILNEETNPKVSSNKDEVILSFADKIQIKVTERKAYKAIRIHPSLHEIIKYSVRKETMSHYVENLILQDLKKKEIINEEINQKFKELQQRDGRKTKR
ncbi:MAG: hypothetical protein ACPGVD_03415 [Flavobacteriales bacterium]